MTGQVAQGRADHPSGEMIRISPNGDDGMDCDSFAMILDAFEGDSGLVVSELTLALASDDRDALIAGLQRLLDGFECLDLGPLRRSAGTIALLAKSGDWEAVRLMVPGLAASREISLEFLRDELRRRTTRRQGCGS